MPYKDPEQQKQHHHEYYIKNREKLSLEHRKYLKKNSEKIKQLRHKFYEENKDQLMKEQKIWRESLRGKTWKSEYQRKYREVHREHLCDISKKWRLKNRESYLKKQRDYSHTPEKREKVRNEYLKLKTQVYNILGNKCANPKCAVPGGMTDIRALQIDHINGGGVLEHAAIHIRGIYRKIINGSKDYQLLCASCNWIKRAEKGESSFGTKKKGIV